MIDIVAELLDPQNNQRDKCEVLSYAMLSYRSSVQGCKEKIPYVMTCGKGFMLPFDLFGILYDPDMDNQLAISRNFSICLQINILVT